MKVQLYRYTAHFFMNQYPNNENRYKRNINAVMYG